MRTAVRSPALARVLAVSVAAMTARVAIAAPNILFVGNSFTHGNNTEGDPHAPGGSSTFVYDFNRGNVTDENGTGMGGVPGIFKALTVQAGLSYNVSIEAVSGQSLQYHLANKSGIIGQSRWDTVVLQDVSTNPLPALAGGDRYAEQSASFSLKRLINSAAPAAKLLLYETWASPTGVADANNAAGSAYYPASTTNDSAAASGLNAMQADLQSGVFATAMRYGFGAQNVARVGDAFVRAVNAGIADPTPTGGPSSGVSLWKNDVRHGGVYGSFLSAAVMYAKISGNDPRSLSTGAGSAAASLQINSTVAASLLQVAYDINSAPQPALQVPLPLTTSGFGGSFDATTKTIAGVAKLSSVTTAEGTFQNLVGATATAISSSAATAGQINAIAAPTGASQAAKLAAVASGLTADDGVNNMTSGQFQFSQSFTGDTRFLIVESGASAGQVGDAATVRLINAAGAVLGSYSLSLLDADFTAAVAGNVDNALAVLRYTQGSNTTDQFKLGAVSFSLADLKVIDPTLVATATGIQITSTGLDPNVVALYTVPEPAGMCALAGALMLGLRGRRRAV